MAKHTIGPIDPKKVVDTVEMASDEGSGLSNGELIRTIATDATTVDAATQAVNRRHKRHSVAAEGVRDQLIQVAVDLEAAASVDTKGL